MSCGVGHRHGSDPLLLGCGAAVASVRPLAWEPPYAAVAALKRQKKKKKRLISSLPIEVPDEVQGAQLNLSFI